MQQLKIEKLKNRQNEAILQFFRNSWFLIFHFLDFSFFNCSTKDKFIQTELFKNRKIVTLKHQKTKQLKIEKLKNRQKETILQFLDIKFFKFSIFICELFNKRTNLFKPKFWIELKNQKIEKSKNWKNKENLKKPKKWDLKTEKWNWKYLKI